MSSPELEGSVPLQDPAASVAVADALGITPPPRLGLIPGVMPVIPIGGISATVEQAASRLATGGAAPIDVSGLGRPVATAATYEQSGAVGATVRTMLTNIPTGVPFRVSWSCSFSVAGAILNIDHGFRLAGTATDVLLLKAAVMGEGSPAQGVFPWFETAAALDSIVSHAAFGGGQEVRATHLLELAA